MRKLSKENLNYISEISFKSIQEDQFGPNFYKGTIGQAWFLLFSGLKLNEKTFLEAAIKKTELSIERLNEIPSILSAGFYEGRSGTLAVGLVIAHLLESSSLKQRILQEWEKNFLNNLFDTTEEDIFSGWSGSLISFKIAYPLLSKKIKNKQLKEIKSWIECEIPNRGFKNNLPGLAHGLSGLALGLRLFSKIDNWDSGLRIAKFLENNIDSNFEKDLGGWESSNEIKKAFESWCNGSAGIILGRKLSGGRFKKSVDFEILSKRLEERVLNCRDNDFHLCHGSFGFIAAHNLITKKQLQFSLPLERQDFQQGLISGDEGIAYSLLSQSYHCPSVLAGIKIN